MLQNVITIFYGDGRMQTIKQLICLSCFIVLGTAIGAVDSHAHERDTTPCSVDVVFGDDDHGVFTAFILKLQHKNNSLRDVEGVSVLVQDSSGAVVNNSDAKCNIETGGLRAGDTGQCQKTLQIITGKMAQKVGYDIWVKMIEDQKQQFMVAQKCEVTGVSYRQ